MISVPKNRLIVFLAIAIIGCGIDLGTKSWIFATVGFPGTEQAAKNDIAIIPQHFSFTTNLNEGALFGIGQGGSWLFAALSGLAAIGIVYWLFFLGAARDWVLTIALGCVMAGIFGNLYDRLGMHGLTWKIEGYRSHHADEPVYAVRDWLYFRTINFPIFNLADSLLVCGAGMLLLHAFLANKKAAAEKAAA